VTTGPDSHGTVSGAPPPDDRPAVDRDSGDRHGRRPVRWATALVGVALLGAAAAVFFADRGAANNGDVTFVTATATAGASATPLLGSGGAAAATGTAGASATGAAGTATLAPTATPTEAPPRVRLSAEAVGIGETFAIRVFAPEAGSGAVVANGVSSPLLAEDGGTLFGVVGIPLNAALGTTELLLTLRDDFGTVIEERAVPFEIVTVDRPVDYLALTEEQGAVLTPGAAVLEARLRNEQFLSFDRQRRWDGLFLVPVQGYPTTEFGQGRSINGGPFGGFHSGADIANEACTPIRAAAAGRVAWTGEMPIRGNSVIVDHGGGVKTGYHHLQAILVEVGQAVTPGMVLGEMGSTGLSTGPHLHWELTIYGVNVDPITWTEVDFSE